MEKPEILIFATAGKNKTLYVTNYEGKTIDSQKMNITEPYGAYYDKNFHRIIVKCSSTAIRIYRVVLDNFGEFKKIDTEFLCTGHSGKVLDGSFSSDGSRLISISTDKKVKMWDLSGRSFVDSNVPQVCSHEVEEPYRVIDWCKWLDQSKNTAIICLVGERCLDYFKIGPDVFEKVDSVEDPHLGSRCETLLTVNKDGKGVGLISRAWDRIISWKPKIKHIE